MRQDLPDSELDARLTEALKKLPDAPVASNFTARLMQAVDREEARTPRGWRGWHLAWPSLLPRVAVAAVVLLSATFAFHQHELASHRHQMATSVALITTQPLPSVDALKNFDAIQRMGQPTHTAHADDELLALYQ